MMVFSSMCFGGGAQVLPSRDPCLLSKETYEALGPASPLLSRDEILFRDLGGRLHVVLFSTFWDVS